MIEMRIIRCSTCEGIFFRVTGKALELRHDECLGCKNHREGDEREAFEREQFGRERRRLEDEEMERHYRKHPHG